MGRIYTLNDLPREENDISLNNNGNGTFTLQRTPTIIPKMYIVNGRAQVVPEVQGCFTRLLNRLKRFCR